MRKSSSNARAFFACRLTVEDHTKREPDLSQELVLVIGLINTTRNRVEILFDGTENQFEFQEVNDKEILTLFLNSSIGKNFLRRKKRIMHIVTDYDVLGKLIQDEITRDDELGKIKYGYYPIIDEEQVGISLSDTRKLFESSGMTVVEDFPEGIPDDLVKYSVNRGG